MTGEGLRDIYDKVRASAVRITQRIKDTLGGPRAGPSPNVRSWLARYGELKITSIPVCKKPISSAIAAFANGFSQGKLKEAMNKQGYENLMHLYAIVTLEGGPTVKIEKNHVVEIKPSDDVGKEALRVPNASGTISGLFEAAQKRVGADKLWKYHLVTQNCQEFLLDLLGGMATGAVRTFVKQDIATTLQEMGLFQRIATVATDIAGAADVALNGARQSRE